MNKDELLSKEATDGVGGVFFDCDVKEFLDSNVCIPKGENRHPYADVYHLMLEEGHSLEPSQDTGWYAFKTYIKPLEPVYEWQWVCQENKGTEFFVPVGWHTFEELQPQVYSLSRLEETKRVR